MIAREARARVASLAFTLAVAAVAAVAPATTAGCVFDQRLKHDYGVVPEPLDDGWEIGTPESAGLSTDVLDRIHAELLREDRFPGSLGMLVVADGKLVWETYLRRPDDRDRYHAIQSVTKSVTSIVFGRARDEGYFGSLDETIASIFPDEMGGLDPRKPAITLRQLLTMSSGLDFENVDFSLEMWTFHHDDPLRYILDKPLLVSPGTRFHYHDVDPQIVGYALQRRTGATERALADAWLFRPLGITDWYWDKGHDDGVTMAAHGLHLHPRDLAKIGQLVLDRGVWHGSRVVSARWVDDMTVEHTITDTSDEHGGTFGYGYYWYIVDRGAAAWGNGGQYVVVVPSKRLVLVHVALPDTADMDGSRLGQLIDLVHDLL